MVRWMLSKDVDKTQKIHTGTFILNSQDNLHVFIRPFIKEESGQSNSVVISGTKIIGSFTGKTTYAGSKVDDFKGSDRAYKYLSDTARSLGVTMEQTKTKDQDEDWDAVEFYLKSNPGALTRK